MCFAVLEVAAASIDHPGSKVQQAVIRNGANHMVGSNGLHIEQQQQWHPNILTNLGHSPSQQCLRKEDAEERCPVHFL